MEKFRKLGIGQHIIRKIEEEKFTSPSLIQEKAIPLVLEGKDIIASSATGSGKTLAFGAGIIQNLEKGKGIQALVMTPTRELAEQVCKSLKSFSKYKPLDIIPVYGGVSINPQMDQLRKADVVVGTPGRLLDHLGRRTIALNKVKILVLDEADRMFEMGFIEDVEQIIRACPRERQTLLFSATIPPDIRKLTQRYMKNPVSISAEQYVDPKKLAQIYYDVQDNMKFSLLVQLLKKEKTGLVMVFCNTRTATDFVANNLKFNSVNAMAIHGGLSQAKRTEVMEMFHSGKVYVLVCTDVAARGLDIPGVSHVYNYETPKDSKQYIHRIGRTARAGKEGIAVNLIGSNDHENYSRVLRDNDVDVPKVPTPLIERAVVKWTSRPRRFSGPGGSRFGNEQRGRFGQGNRFSRSTQRRRYA